MVHSSCLAFCAYLRKCYHPLEYDPIETFASNYQTTYDVAAATSSSVPVPIVRTICNLIQLQLSVRSNVIKKHENGHREQSELIKSLINHKIQMIH